MKFKKIITISLAAAMAMTATVSAAAAELTEQNPTGNTEVTAHINGSAGNVSYIITIPDVVDFGELVQPSNNDNFYKYVDYEPESVKLKRTTTPKR